MNSFTFVPTFLTDIVSLPYEQRCKIIDAICYWGVYRKLPEQVEGDAIIAALLMNPQRMIEGQDKYKEKSMETGKKGGRAAAITDEKIIEGYIKLYNDLGRKPTEKEVIEFCGGGVQRIGTRSVWKKRDEYLYESMKDTIHTNVWNETYKDTYNTNIHTNDTYTDIQNLNENNKEVCMELDNSATKTPFDF